MLKRELMPGIIQYIFDPLPGMHFGNSVTALINYNKVLLIDTAYEEQAILILKDMKNNGLYIEKIIITHFHDDHMQGLKVLPKISVYGSKHYKTTLDMWTERDINNRIAYFNAILNSNRRIPYEEAIKDCDCEFLDSECHEYVYD
jgi:glyoxylase-like metal-dependent hydrolase (beta-lactamase superfamily II)